MSALHGQSQLRFASSGPHSLPRWKTRGHRCDLFPPLQEKSNSWNLSGQPIASDHGNQHHQIHPGWPFPSSPSLKHTNRDVLAGPFNNNKKPGWGQRFPPHPVDFSDLFNRVQLPCSIFEGKVCLSLGAQLIAGVVGNTYQRSRHAIQIHDLAKLNPLGDRHARNRFVFNVL